MAKLITANLNLTKLNQVKLTMVKLNKSSQIMAKLK
jgi:hypothetical protein